MLNFYENLSPLEKNAVLENVYKHAFDGLKEPSSPTSARRTNNIGSSKSPRAAAVKKSVSPQQHHERYHSPASLARRTNNIPQYPLPPIRNSNRAVNGGDNDNGNSASRHGRHPIAPIAVPKHEKPESDAARRARERRAAERAAYEEERRRKKAEEEEAERRRLEREEQERLEREKRRREEAQRLREEAERRAAEEAANLAKLEEMRRQREEEERRRKEELERRRREEEERKRMEEEEKRQKLEAERLEKERIEREKREREQELLDFFTSESDSRKAIEVDEREERDLLILEIKRQQKDLQARWKKFIAQQQEDRDDLFKSEETGRQEIVSDEQNEWVQLSLNLKAEMNEKAKEEETRQAFDKFFQQEQASRRAIEQEAAAVFDTDVKAAAEQDLEAAKEQENARRQKEEIDAAAAEQRRREDDERKKREEEARRKMAEEEAEKERLAAEEERRRRKELAEKALADARAKAEAEEAARLKAEEAARLAALKAAAEKEEHRREGIKQFFSERPKVQPWHLMMPTEKKEYRELFELMSNFRDKGGLSKEEFLKALDTEWPGHKLANRASVDKAFDFATKDSTGGVKDVDELITALQFTCYANNLQPLFADVNEDGVGTISKEEFKSCSSSFEIAAPNKEWKAMFEYINKSLGTELDPASTEIPFDLFVFWLSKEKPNFDVEVEETEEEEEVPASQQEEL